MREDMEKIYSEALALPEEARMSLIDKLLQSLHLPTQEEIDRAWAEEAERRLAQIERGEVELIPGEEFFAKLREKYRR
ncbi:MAG TPA: addiction module protein [bacterium]|nr:addiction module protein [bacterium]